MNNIALLFIGVTLIGVELLYFRLARRLQILDHPNNRSMHIKPTIRGGGVVFFMSALVYFIVTFKPSGYFIVGILLVSVVGFMDDLKGMSSLLRFVVQSIAFLLVFYDLNLFSEPIWLVLLVFIVATGTINAYNFMDGINGITGGYSLVAIGSLYYINEFLLPFVDSYFLLVMALGLMIFNYFNFRKKAVCFAGDVGSLSIGFTIIYLIMRLIITSHNYVFVLLLAVYGVDTVLTILHRLKLRENIFKPHRLHLFQVVISRTGMPHLQMTVIYMSVQLLVNVNVIYNLFSSAAYQAVAGGVILVSLGALYILLKVRYFEGKTS